MARRNKKRENKRVVAVQPSARHSHSTEPHSEPSERHPHRSYSRRKLWGFRLTAALGVPLVMLALVELGLRIANTGYPTSFLLESDHYQQATHVENGQFGWRFFGPELARSPAPLALPVAKRSNTRRIFVFGESAAFGDPQPDFGLPRMLQVMLSAQYPELRFEVVNAAMTGINSHAIREIARDCTSADGDLWVIYMGNNEVVGPFGAGTVFGSQTPPLNVIRATLALKTSRTGQVFDEIVRWSTRAARPPEYWGGMAMFRENHVPHDDPRMQRVYAHYRQNLQEIIDIGLRSGASVIVSTVAVNLKDCPPFASGFSRRLTRAEQSAWTASYDQGVAAYEAGNFHDAARYFAQAADVDDRVANLQYLWGRARLALGQTDEAREHLKLARDLDRLRFRCDSQMQSIVREVAEHHRSESVRLVDAAEAFDRASSAGVTGREHFYEHVHLNFAGNYLLARLIVEHAAALLPGIPPHPPGDWPTLQECADRLAWSDVAHYEVLTDLLNRLSDVPFTAQLQHEQILNETTEQFRQLGDATGPDALEAAVQQCQQAAETAPDDHALQSRLALLLGRANDLEGAYEAAQKAAQLLPHDVEKWYQLGLVLARQNRLREALEAFEAAHQRSPRDPVALHAQAQTLLRLDRPDKALQVLEQVFEMSPYYGPAYLTAGLILDSRGDSAAAEHMFHQAMERRVLRVADLATLAKVCLSKGWYEQAVANYLDALRLHPTDPTLHLGAAQSLTALGQHEPAERHFREAIRLMPQSAQLHYELGVHFAKREEHAAAAEQFEAAAKLDPDFLLARVDFGMALIALGRLSDALEQFKKVLDRDPQHAVALEYKAAIENELAASNAENP